MAIIACLEKGKVKRDYEGDSLFTVYPFILFELFKKIVSIYYLLQNKKLSKKVN